MASKNDVINDLKTMNAPSFLLKLTQKSDFVLNLVSELCNSNATDKREIVSLSVTLFGIIGAIFVVIFFKGGQSFTIYLNCLYGLNIVYLAAVHIYVRIGIVKSKQFTTFVLDFLLLANLALASLSLFFSIILVINDSSVLCQQILGTLLAANLLLSTFLLMFPGWDGLFLLFQLAKPKRYTDTVVSCIVIIIMLNIYHFYGVPPYGNWVPIFSLIMLIIIIILAFVDF